jgi:hypothetical protein
MACIEYRFECLLAAGRGRFWSRLNGLPAQLAVTSYRDAFGNWAHKLNIFEEHYRFAVHQGGFVSAKRCCRKIAFTQVTELLV